MTTKMTKDQKAKIRRAGFEWAQELLGDAERLLELEVRDRFKNMTVERLFGCLAANYRKRQPLS